MKRMLVTMPDSSVWAIPLGLISANRTAYYKMRGEDVSDETLDDYDYEDWAANNMNWSDVAHLAVMVKPPRVDYEDGWANGDKEIER